VALRNLDVPRDRDGRSFRGPDPTISEITDEIGEEVLPTKNDRLDSVVLARLPLLHPEGLRAHVGDGPGDPLRRATKQRSSIIKRRSAIFARIDALLELAGPGW